MEPDTHRLSRMRQVAAISLFAVFLILPVTDCWLRYAPSPKLTEMRLPHAQPALEWNRRSLRRFPASYEAYFNDAFGFRNLLTYAYNWMKFFWLKDSPVPLARVGRDGWLYFGKPDETAAYQHLDAFSEDELRRLSAYFMAIQNWLASRGSKFVVMIVPNKSTLYPEHMPANLRRATGPSRLDQFVDRGRQCGLNVIDLRETFEPERARAPVYYRLDAHWTPYGALLASRELMKALAPDGAVPGDLQQLTWSTNVGFYTTADMARLMGLDHLLREPLVTVNWTPPIPANCISGRGTLFGGTIEYETDQTNLPMVVLFRDSFAEFPFMDCLASHSRRLVARWTYRFEPAVVEAANPDVVVVEFVERILHAPEFFGDQAATVSRMLKLQLATACSRRVGDEVSDPGALLGVARHAAPPTPRGWLMFGRYVTLSPGPYVATFRIKAAAGASAPIARLDISAARGTQQLAAKTIDAGTPRNWGAWEDVALPFEVPSPGASGVEYRVEYLGGGDFSIDYVKVTPQSGAAEATR